MRARRLCAVLGLGVVVGLSASGVLSQTVTYQYDNAGRLRSATYGSMQVAYKLDAAGNRITVTTAPPPIAQEFKASPLNESHILLAWSLPEGTASQAYVYTIERHTDGALADAPPAVVAQCAESPCVYEGLEPGRVYAYTLKVSNAQGEYTTAQVSGATQRPEHS